MPSSSFHPILDKVGGRLCSVVVVWPGTPVSARFCIQALSHPWEGRGQFELVLVMLLAGEVVRIMVTLCGLFTQNQNCENIDHFEEIVSVTDETGANLSNGASSTAGKDKARVVKTGTVPDEKFQVIEEVQGNSFQDCKLGQTLIRVTVRNGPIRGQAAQNEGSKMQVKEGVESTEIAAVSDVTRLSCNHEPHCIYGGFVPPCAAGTNKEQRLPSYGYHPPAVTFTPPVESARLPRKSQSDVWTPPSRGAAPGQKRSSLRRYPYNPDFNCPSQEACKESANALLAAYQQENSDIPKGRSQV